MSDHHGNHRSSHHHLVRAGLPALALAGCRGGISDAPPVLARSQEQKGGDPLPVNRVPLLADGAVFETISIGKTTMPAYGPRIPVEDRWRIIQYVRALQNLGKQ